MATDFAINGTTLTHIDDCQWIDEDYGSYLNGKTTVSRWRTVRLSGQVMEETQFDLLYAQEGQKVSLTIPDYTSRNSDFKIYYGCDLLSIDGDHRGPVFVNVRVELRVLV